MKAKVHYVDLTKAMLAEINSLDGGWGSPAGKAYLSAQAGQVDVHNYKLWVPVAELDAETAEEVWMTLQNSDKNWTEKSGIDGLRGQCERSMDVGDLVEWENGVIERVASAGFETVSGRFYMI